MTIELLFKEIKALRLDVQKLTGTRLDHDAFAVRLGVTKRTLYNRIKAGSVPLPESDGKWLLSKIMEWEDSSEQVAQSSASQMG